MLNINSFSQYSKNNFYCSLNSIHGCWPCYRVVPYSKLFLTYQNHLLWEQLKLQKIGGTPLFSQLPLSRNCLGDSYLISITMAPTIRITKADIY